MRRIKSAPANIAGMVNRKTTTKDLIIPREDENIKLKDKAEDKMMRTEIIRDSITTTINEYISDPNIVPMDESPLIVYMIIYIRENIKRRYNWEQAKEFLIQHIIRYAIGFVIHHHMYDKIPKLIQQFSH